MKALMLHSLTGARRNFASIALTVSLLSVSSGCSTIRSSSVVTNPSAGRSVVAADRVRLAATWVLPGATEIGIVEVHGRRDEGLVALLAGFREEVVRTGGTFGKIDSMRTRFEIVRSMQHQTYSCGTPQAPRTCSRQVMQSVEVGTTTIMGRAFREGEI